MLVKVLDGVDACVVVGCLLRYEMTTMTSVSQCWEEKPTTKNHESIG